MVNVRSRKKNSLVVEIMGELDHHHANQIKFELDELLYDPSVKELVLDLNNLKFMDSSGIGVIIGRYKTVKSRNGNVYVTNVNETVSKLLDLAGLYKIIKRK